jgi:hypothetical protein
VNDKFNVSVEENIEFVKRNVIDYIYSSIKLEGLGITFPNTKDIFLNGSANGVKLEDIIVVNNLKNSWKFVFDNIGISVNLGFACRINSILGIGNVFQSPGIVRSWPVAIGNTDWRPSMPDKKRLSKDIDRYLLGKSSVTEKCIDLMLYLMRCQAFSDGNKRTSMLMANTVMISNGKGVISVGEGYIRDFWEYLIYFYEYDDPREIKNFVYDNCIFGPVPGIEANPMNSFQLR